MNILEAKVKNIQNIDNLHLVDFEFENQTLRMVSLELNHKIDVNVYVRLQFKPTSVTLAKDFDGLISFSNKIDTTIENIQKGKLLSVVKIKTKTSSFESLVTVDSINNMNIKKDDKIIAFIKASDLSIKEILI
jgi:molybdopterin-binding protein